MFYLTGDPKALSFDEQSFITGVFDQTIDVKKFAKWVDTSFTLQPDQNLKQVLKKWGGDGFEAKGVDIRNGTGFRLRLKNDE